MTLQPRIEELKKLYEKMCAAEVAHVRNMNVETFSRSISASGAFTEALHDAFPAIVEALEKRWIPVTEPPIGLNEILVACPEGVSIGYFDKDERRFYWHNDLVATDATHWQPLPAPPTPKVSAT